MVGEFGPNVDLIGRGVQVLDPDGRVWCMLGDRWGFFRTSGGWMHGRRGDVDVEAVLVSSPVTVAALDAWEMGRCWADPDPTPAAGIARPALRLVGAR